VRRLLRLAALAFVLAAPSCGNQGSRAPDGVLVVSQEQTASWIRNFNPLTTATAARWPTLAGVYEPLYVFNSAKSVFVPWLAVSHEWRDENFTLRLTTRENVLWSDGRAFSAYDVAFTFQLLRDVPAMDRNGVWRFLEDVRVLDERNVEFRFQRVFIPGLDDIVAQLIVPEHIWSEIDDPLGFANENPVATGPFTEVRIFRNQVYELGRNPRYWQEGRPQIEALRFPAYPSNDRANMAIVFDEVDWAGRFLPAIERVYVERDPEHHRYWFPLTGSTVFLYSNTTRAPFDDVRVRKALSLAIDRQLVIDVALHRYSRPADATALSDAYESWRNPEIAALGDWVRYDVEGANALLDEAGYALGADGVRRHPDGTRWEYDIYCVAGWSDWVRAVQVIANGLADVGIRASVKTPDFGAWFQRIQIGEFDLSIGWSEEGPTPYTFYRWLMSSATVKPIGESTIGNWHRYASPAADAILRAFELEPDRERQRELCDDLQRTFVAEAPAIPLYPNPSWAEFNTKRFVGFPSPENPYANPSPNKFPRGETLLVLTTVAPREDAP
jgi:peptide/nickel transport system substrate-binding protein